MPVPERRPLGYRAFVFENEKIHRIPLRIFTELHPDGSRLREFAGRRVRTAFVTVELDGRKPCGIWRTEFHYYELDRTGRVSTPWWERLSRESVKLMGGALSLGFPRPPTVVDASAKFARRSYDHEFRWTPTRAEWRQLGDAIFGPGCWQWGVDAHRLGPA